MFWIYVLTAMFRVTDISQIAHFATDISQIAHILTVFVCTLIVCLSLSVADLREQKIKSRKHGYGNLQPASQPKLWTATERQGSIDQPCPVLYLFHLPRT